MKRTVVLTALLAIATGAPAAELSGVWNGAFRVPNSERDVSQLFTLKQAGDKITGTGGPDSSEQYPVLHGEVMDHRVKFEIKTANRDFLYDLKERGNRIRGTLTIKGPEDTRTAEVWLKLVQ